VKAPDGPAHPLAGVGQEFCAVGQLDPARGCLGQARSISARPEHARVIKKDSGGFFRGEGRIAGMRWRVVVEAAGFQIQTIQPVSIRSDPEMMAVRKTKSQDIVVGQAEGIAGIMPVVDPRIVFQTVETLQ